MPSGIRFDSNVPHHSGVLTGGRITADLPQSSNIDDAIRLSSQDSTKDDPLLSNLYSISDDALVASGAGDSDGPSIDTQVQEYLRINMEDNFESDNLYAFIPGIFYCSSQQTSVDAVLIEVTQNQRFGMTLSSFKPEDVRPLDLAQGMMLDENGFGKSIQLGIDTLGTFHSESFLKDSGISQYDVQYCREIELAKSLSQWLTLPILKQAYAASSFLQTRLMKLLEDIEFFGFLPRRRIYVRNEMHPYGSIIETKYQGFDNILDLSDRRGVACPDEIDLEMQLNTLAFSKMIGVGTETDIEGAIMDLFSLIAEDLDGKVSKEDVLTIFTRRAPY